MIMTDVDRTVYCQQGPDELLPAGLGNLTGLRFVFKDLFDVKGYVTGAGNPAWLATHQPAEGTSPIITELLAQGAECVGRVQTDELAYSLNGQNVHYGTPVNPKAEDCIPGGSSSGSAVAVARGEADFAIGTDTGGPSGYRPAIVVFMACVRRWVNSLSITPLNSLRVSIRQVCLLVSCRY
jgi:aspartyl-tRNA(Asn)/glutamyl-tRNA(Gln) amidotransferase subunit A